MTQHDFRRVRVRYHDHGHVKGTWEKEKISEVVRCLFDLFRADMAHCSLYSPRGIWLIFSSCFGIVSMHILRLPVHLNYLSSAKPTWAAIKCMRIVNLSGFMCVEYP